MLSRTASKRLQARVPTRASEPQGPCPLRLPEVPGLRHLRSSNQWFLRQFSVSENDPQERSRRTRECRCLLPNPPPFRQWHRRAKYCSPDRRQSPGSARNQSEAPGSQTACQRSEERRVGKECVSACRYRGGQV